MDRLLTIRELAERLNVKISWIYARTEKNAKYPIPVIRLGTKKGMLRFRESDVLQWLKEAQ